SLAEPGQSAGHDRPSYPLGRSGRLRVRLYLRRDERRPAQPDQARSSAGWPAPPRARAVPTPHGGGIGLTSAALKVRNQARRPAQGQQPRAPEAPVARTGRARAGRPAALPAPLPRAEVRMRITFQQLIARGGEFAQVGEKGYANYVSELRRYLEANELSPEDHVPETFVADVENYVAELLPLLAAGGRLRTR